MAEKTRQFPRYDELPRTRLAERRSQAIDALRAIDQFVLSAGGRLVVFGSLVEGGFSERSDIDLALFGIPAGRDTDVAIEIGLRLADAGFSANIIPERFLSTSSRQRMNKRGQAVRSLV